MHLKDEQLPLCKNVEYPSLPPQSTAEREPARPGSFITIHQ